MKVIFRLRCECVPGETGETPGHGCVSRLKLQLEFDLSIHDRQKQLEGNTRAVRAAE